MRRIYDLFYDNPEFFEIGMIFLAVLLFYIFDKKLNINTWYLLFFVIIFLVIGFLGIKYFRERK